jgi:hypothetical protein
MLAFAALCPFRYGRTNTLEVEAIIVAQNSTAPHPPCGFPAPDYPVRAPYSAAFMQPH